MKLKPRRSEDPEVNLTSLIDVVLLLVVFFMLSSTFIDEGRLKVQLPEASLVPAEKGADEPLVITVTQTGGYRVNERELINASADTLRAAIQQVAGADRRRPITIRADARATHQAVVTAMDVLGRLGFARVNIATVSETPAKAQ
jgi:biopolymer transport protein ExbD